MPEQTTSSIVIDAPAPAVMAVIADFPAYPEWAQGMQKAEVVETGADGRGTKVDFELEATPINTRGGATGRSPGTWSRAGCSRP
jgi:hypothetical protein